MTIHDQFVSQQVHATSDSRASSTGWRFSIVTTIAAGIAFPSTASAIYINPVHNDGSAVAKNLADTDRPAVGLVNSSCTGSLLHTNILPARSYVITAGHCVDSLGDTDGRFKPQGTSGTEVNSVTVRRHTDYYAIPNDDGNRPFDLSNDVALYRLATINNVPVLQMRPFGPNNPRPVLRTQETPLTAIGFGSTGFDDMTAMNTGFPKKREAVFPTITGFHIAGETNVEFPKAGNGTNGNPTRHLCGGDSGGPLLHNGLLVGVHSYVTGDRVPNSRVIKCNGSSTSQGSADVTRPLLYNYIDSYSLQANFWDDLRVYQMPGNENPPATPPDTLPNDWMARQDLFDSFESGIVRTETGYRRGLTGLPASWGKGPNEDHPTLTSPGAANGVVNGGGFENRYRYFNAIGRANDGTTPDLYRTDLSGLGAIVQSGGADTVTRGFSIAHADVTGKKICVYVQQRWNSLTIGADVGLFVNTQAAQDSMWSGLTYGSETVAANALDTWRWHRACVVVPNALVGTHAHFRMSLLTVPEPTSAVTVALGLLLLTGWHRGSQPKSSNIGNP